MKSVVFKLCSLEALRRLPCREVAGPPILSFLQIFTKHQLCAGAPRNNGEREARTLTAQVVPSSKECSEGGVG